MDRQTDRQEIKIARNGKERRAEDEVELMNTVVIEWLGGGSLTNRAALPPYLPQFRGNRSPRYFIDMPTIDIHRSR